MMTEAQRSSFLQRLWSILSSFVDGGAMALRRVSSVSSVCTGLSINENIFGILRVANRSPLFLSFRTLRFACDRVSGTARSTYVDFLRRLRLPGLRGFSRLFFLFSWMRL